VKIKTIFRRKVMKNKLFFAGMAALALTFGLVLTGCDNGGGGGGGGDGSGNGGGGSGDLWSRLTDGTGTWIPSSDFIFGENPSIKFKDEGGGKGYEVCYADGRPGSVGTCVLGGNNSIIARSTNGSETFRASLPDGGYALHVEWSNPDNAPDYTGDYKKKR
jgi:hypothetical protein